jgi:hypothetical protein
LKNHLHGWFVAFSAKNASYFYLRLLALLEGLTAGFFAFSPPPARRTDFTGRLDVRSAPVGISPTVTYRNFGNCFPSEAKQR